jgi:FkbM family methyltransferase
VGGGLHRAIVGCAAGAHPGGVRLRTPSRYAIRSGGRLPGRFDRDISTGQPPMQPLRIRLRDDEVRLAVPADLSSITTYVLLEQETWFEKELAFLRRWLKPGMTAIDVGANLGVYALAMARLVGPRGRVFAYEPGSEARRLLEQSRDLNAAANLEVIGLALSDREREGRLMAGASTELSALGDGEEGEPVRITALDSERARFESRAPDFIKIDAEGEEERILAGGRELFARHSPLVMFEIKSEKGINAGLVRGFAEMGYRPFRLLAGAPIVVPFDPAVALDPFELNLFVAKPDRVASLRADELAVDHIAEWDAGPDAVASGLRALGRKPFARMFGERLKDRAHIDPDYAAGLAAFAAWRNTSEPASKRCAAVYSAYRTLAALCNRAPTTARYSTFARVAWEGGWRGESVEALRQMAAYTRQNPFQPTEPCWPANPRFDEIAAGGNPALWFATATVEQLETCQGFSSYFTGMSPWLEWLCRQPLASHEMHRRKTLIEARSGGNPLVPAVLRKAAEGHLNGDIWRGGRVPGTRLDP